MWGPRTLNADDDDDDDGRCSTCTLPPLPTLKILTFEGLLEVYM